MSDLTPPQPGADRTGVPPVTPPPLPPYAAAPSYQPPAYPVAPPTYGQQPVQQYPGAAPSYAPYGYAAYPTQKTNVLSVISMIASILGIVWILPFVGSLAGVIMGHISLSQLKTSGEKGRGMALAGVIVGWIGLGFAILLAIAFFGLFAYGASSSGTYA